MMNRLWSNLFFAGLLCVFWLVSVHVSAIRGIDLSTAECSDTNQDTWNCLKKDGNDFAIVQIIRGGYGIGPDTARCVAQARAAGIQFVDVYIFMCPHCSGQSSASEVIQSAVDYLHSNSVNFGMIWLDVEQCSGCWNAASANAQYVKEAITKLNSLGIHFGLYSSLYEWKETVGDSVIDPSVPLWYAHYDNSPAFSDPDYWKFGGWSKPAIKQYKGTTAMCGVGVDLNFY
jgi:GH25 family lysozyme M1 (1,4-beta-N-acetylmuramidase)